MLYLHRKYWVFHSVSLSENQESLRIWCYKSYFKFRWCDCNRKTKTFGQEKISPPPNNTIQFLLLLNKNINEVCRVEDMRFHVSSFAGPEKKTLQAIPEGTTAFPDVAAGGICLGNNKHVFFYRPLFFCGVDCSCPLGEFLLLLLCTCRESVKF